MLRTRASFLGSSKRSNSAFDLSRKPLGVVGGKLLYNKECVARCVGVTYLLGYDFST